MKNVKKQQDFIYSDLSKLKMFTLVIIFLSLVNLIFAIIFKEAYKLENIVSACYIMTMVLILLNGIFG